MKILVLSNLYPPDTVGGYELGCRQVVDALLARGHDVRVVTTAPRTPVVSPPHVVRTLKLTDMWDYYSDARSTPVAPARRSTESVPRCVVLRLPGTCDSTSAARAPGTS